MATQFDPSFGYTAPVWNAAPVRQSDAGFLQSLQNWGGPAPQRQMSTASSFADFGNEGMSKSLMGINSTNGMASAGDVALPRDWMGSLSEFLGGKRNADGSTSMGAGGALIGGASALGNLWMGMKNYGMAQKQLAFQQDAFNKNYGNQVKSTNNALEGRATDMASASSLAPSVADYMAKRRVG